MAFPTTSVLDDFNRPDGPLGVNWTNGIRAGAPDTVVINTNKANTDTGLGTAWWNAASFGPSSEVFATESVADDGFALYTNLQSPGTGAADGYCFRSILGTNTGRIQRMDDDSLTTLGATFAYDTIAAGDSFGGENLSGSLSFYQQHSAGAWTAYANRTDTTYAGGFIGLEVGEPVSGGFWDNFGGGSVVVPAPPLVSDTPPIIMGFGSC